MPYWFDGNNLIGLSAAAARQDSKTRQAFLAFLGGLAISRGGRFLVFFDGDDPGCSGVPRGVRVRYSAPLSTDDAILHELDGVRAPAEVIVVTNDHCLAAQCRSAGSRTMNWRQFTSRVTTSARAQQPTPAGQEKINVDDWSKFFGFDPDSLQ